MKSKGGKITYLCPDCLSEDLEKALVHGQNSYICHGCNEFAPWSDRAKVPNRYMPEVAALIQELKNHDDDN